MTERFEQMFWEHKTGLIIALPPKATERIVQSTSCGQGIPSEEGRRLHIINQDPILKRRFPKNSGIIYMDYVDFGWREELYKKAIGMTNKIVEESTLIGKVAKNKNGKEIAEIAVILFGSVAKGLVRTKNHPDPSNIDLAVIGNFNKEEREELFNRIRRSRESIGIEIGNNAGVTIQCPEKLIKDNYSSALAYIGSSARALYDPMEIWKNIEWEALEKCNSVKRYRPIGKIKK